MTTLTKSRIESIDLLKGLVMVIMERGVFVPYISNGNNLTSDIKLSLSKMKVGEKFYIDTIKVQTSTGIIILPATQIKIRV